MKKLKLIFFITLITPMVIFGQTTTEIAKIGIKSTVSIVALDKTSQPLGFGSGFIIDDETIVTNVHVIEGCYSAHVFLNGQEKKYAVSGYVAIDRTNDLIILKVVGLYGVKLTLGSDDFPEIGEKIYAIGNPKGFNGTFSEGIVSGLRDLAKNKVLQITAPISPGSSGGPVLNSKGQVAGIAFASFSEGQNLNFAIPVKYLSSLKSKIVDPTALSMIKAQPKTKQNGSISPNIKEGVTIRNLTWGCFFPYSYNFSIKNNLPSTVSDVRVLILVYDLTGVIIDYEEETYFKSSDGVKPFLAKTTSCNYNKFADSYKEGYRIKARVLDFKVKDY